MRFMRALLLVGATFLAPGCSDNDGETPPQTPESPGETAEMLELCSADRDFGRFPGLRLSNPLDG